MSEQDGAQPDELRGDSLDISNEAFRALTDRTVTLVADYFARIRELPIFPSLTAEEIATQLSAALPWDGPDDLHRVFEDCRRVIANSRHTSHPRFFGYVASPATAIGAFADLIASALNQNVPAWRSAPAATYIERTTIRWLGQMIGYTQTA